MRRNGRRWVLPSHKNVKTEVVEIDPDTAIRMLAYNQLNRPLSPALVARLSLKMKEGRFLFTHQGIAFSDEQTLLDGQHRLQAIADSGETVQMLVTYNLPPETFKNMDVDGRQRTASDFLAIMNPTIKNRSLVAGTTHAMMRGIEGMHLRYPAEQVAMAASDLIGTVEPLVQILKTASPVVRRAPIVAAFCNAVRKNDVWPGPRGYRELDAVHMAAMRLAEEEWDGAKDPLKTFKKRMERAAISKRGEQITAAAAYALAVAAIRASISNRTLTTITTTEIDWGDKNDQGGPLARGMKKRPSLNRTRLAKRRKKVNPIPGAPKRTEAGA